MLEALQRLHRSKMQPEVTGERCLLAGLHSHLVPLSARCYL
jgi:hypothetical protein